MTAYLRWMTDAGLVRRTLGGNREAFGVLVERHLPMAHALAWGHTGSASDADDVVQDAFLKAFTKLDSLREAEKFPGWLAGIVRNAAADLRAKAARVDTVSAEVLEHLPAPARRLDEEEVYALLREAVLELEGPAREVLTLHYFAQKPLREVAELQGISREAAMKRLQRAREALGKQLLDKLEGAPSPAKRLEARKTAILAVIASAPLAWKAAAATGVSTTVVAASVAVLALLGAFGYAGYEYRDQIFTSDVSSTAANSGVAAPSGSGEPAPPAMPADAQTLASTESPAAATADAHGGSMAGRILDVQGTPVPKATVRIERVDWESPAIPPEKTERFESQSDDNGAVSITGIPFGEYSVVAFSSNAIDVTTTHLSADTPHVEEDLYLKPGLPLAGRVVDSKGSPVAGAVLTPAYYQPMGPIDNETVTSAVRVYTDEKGRFRFGLIWPGGWQLLARAKGFGPTQSNLVEAGTLDALITMQGGGDVVGTVVRADHQPAPKIRVRLQAKSSALPSPVAESDDAGSFHFADVSPGTYEIRLETELTVLKEGPKEITIEAGKEVPLELVIGGGGTISGRVYFADTGEGVPDVRVNINAAGGWNIYREVKTDASGSFFFPLLPDGPYTVNAYSDTGVFPVQRQSDPGLVVSGEREIEVNIPVTRGAKITGKVVDETGAPVGGSFVLSRYNEPESTYGTGSNADAKDDGTFTIWIYPGAKDVQLTAHHGSKHSKPVPVPNIAALGAEGVVLTLSIVADSSVEAKVDVRGLEQYVAAQLLEAALLSRGPQNGYGNTVRVSPTGEIAFKDVLAGRYTILVSQRNMGLQLCESEPFDVPAGKTVSGIQISCLQSGNLTIAGRVVNESNEPIEGATVSVSQSMLQGPKATTGADGTFLLENIRDGSCYVYAAAKGYTGNGTNAEAGSTEVLIRLGDARTIHGRVRDAESGEPVRSFKVQYQSGGGEQNNINYGQLMNDAGRAFTSEDGTFTLEEVPAYNVFVVVSATGYAPEGRVAEVDNEGTLEFALKKGIAISGTVTAPDGRPLSAVTVSLALFQPYASGNPLATTSTDIDGTYSFAAGAILPGNVLHFAHSEFAVTQRAVPDSGRLDVVMDEGGVLEGKVSPWRGDATYTVSMDMQLQSGQHWHLDERRVQSDGTFRIDKLPTGTGRLDLSKRIDETPTSYSSRGVSNISVEIVNGQTTQVVLDATEEEPTPPVDAAPLEDAPQEDPAPAEEVPAATP